MPTTVLNAWSIAYPTISNRIRASVFLQSSPYALVASEIDAIAGHPQRIWSFPGLPRNNYGFSLDEINGSDIVVRNLAFFDVVPGELDGQLIRGDEQIQVDTTPGFVSGTNTFTFDGTLGTPNYIGWQITPSELTGRGILVRGLDYSWDSTTATLVLLQTLDVFASGNYWNIHFDPIQNPAGNSYPTLSDFTIRLETSDFSIIPGDFGNKIIVEPATDYVEASLPDINTVVEGRPLKVEIGGLGISSTRFITFGSDIINYLKGNLISMPGESFTIYKFIRGGVPEWRVCDADGNFKTVGNMVGCDSEVSDIINCQLLDGSDGDIFKNARIYIDFVLNLPLGQLVDYDDWITGNNYLQYSRANSLNPSNLNKFKFPDRTGMFEKNSDGDLVHPGDFRPALTGEYTQVMGDHGDTNTLDFYEAGPFRFKSKIINPGQKSEPENYSTNKYVLL